MHWKLHRLKMVVVSRKDPVLLHDNAWQYFAQPMLQIWMNWAMKFCLICHIHLSSCPLTTISLSVSTTFCMLPQPAGLRKCFPRVCQVPKHGFLCYRDKQTYSLLAKMCGLMVPILINKDILSLVMMIWNLGSKP